MAGATVEVLLRNPVSKRELDRLRSYLEIIASCVEGNSFWVAGQPFSWSESTANDCETGVLGWSPRGGILFCAMCRGLVAEAYLAMLASRVAQMLDGVIALGRHVKCFADDGILVMEGRYEGEHEDYVTPEFLTYWISHPRFRMDN